MTNRLIKLAEALALIELEKAPDGIMREDELLQYAPKQDEDKLDLQADDLANRLEEAVTALEDCVSLLKELGMEEGKAEEKILSIVQNEIQGPEAIPGGLAKGKSDSDFDPDQIEKGIKVELEHTGDREKAKEISQDHLMENPKYYDYLEEMEAKADKDKKKEQEASDSDGSVLKHLEAAAKIWEDSHMWYQILNIKDEVTKAEKIAKETNHPLKHRLAEMVQNIKKFTEIAEFDVMNIRDLVYELKHEDQENE